MSQPPLTVLHVDTERGWRGGERQVLWIAEGQRARGHHPLVAARPGEALAEHAGRAGLAVVPCAPAGELDALAALSLRRVIRRERVQVVHAHTAHALALGAMAALGTPARLVVTRHTGFRLHANPFTRWKYGRARAVIAVSRDVERVLLEGGIERARITVVPSGVRLDRPVASPPLEVRHALGVPAGAPLVVMVGALGADKDPLTFVRAVDVAHRAVPTMRALLVGEGPLRGELEAEIARRGLADVVRLTGFRADADALIAAADVVALSSVHEGLGTVLVDAMALGKPVAATAAGGIPEVVVDGETGLLAPPRDADALGSAIARLLGDRELAARFGRAGLARAPLFSIENTVAGTLAVYERVIAAGSDGR